MLTIAIHGSGSLGMLSGYVGEEIVHLGRAGAGEGDSDGQAVAEA